MESLPDYIPTGLLCDDDIALLSLDHGMITPFAEAEDRPGVISYGLSSFGYDARLGNVFQVFDDRDAWKGRSVIDPKEVNPGNWREYEIEDGSPCPIPPNGFCMAHTLERFKIPVDVLGICLGKSTYARCGIHVNVTPLEPGWEGQVTLEIHNGTPLTALIYAGEGICQFIFLRGQQRPSKTYVDKPGGGKYQGQLGVTPPMVKS